MQIKARIKRVNPRTVVVLLDPLKPRHETTLSIKPSVYLSILKFMEKLGRSVYAHYFLFETDDIGYCIKVKMVD